MKTRLKLISVIMGIAVCAGLFVAIRWQNTSAERLADEYDGDIELPSDWYSHDADGDGICDGEDILQGAIDYISLKPKYKSRYYAETGYPDDGYGVCTDVVAFALKSAGYDLMTLVYEDVIAHPDDYDIDVPNIKIDFRRVKNLRVFFENNAESLTTDIYDIDEWQGGDIVIFERHIGIVSDRRNENGVPYVLHHSNPLQLSYEQDILEKRGDIVGHYRMVEWISASICLP